MLDVGVLVETLETATFWSNLRRAVRRGDGRARPAALGGGSPLVLCHVSHVYETGALALLHGRRPAGRRPARRSGRAAKAAATDAIVAAGATITHHHAVGTDHKPWLAAGDRPGRRRDAARGQGASSTRTGVLNPGVLDPVTASGPTRSASWSTRPPAAGGPGGRRTRWRGCCATPAPASRSTYSPGPRGLRGPRARGGRAAATSWSRSAATGCSPRWPARSSAAGGMLGIVPAGRGNDFARMLGLPDEPAGLARAAARGRRRSGSTLVDVGPARTVARQRLRRGRLAAPPRSSTGRTWLPRSVQYPYAAVRSVLATFTPGLLHRSRSTASELEEPRVHRRGRQLGYYGAGMKIAPAASVTDGLLDVVVIEAASQARA